MWTEEHRRIYRREGAGYPSDLRDAEWARLEPLIPPARPGGRPRKTDLRTAVNAILYLLRTGCPWRYLLRDSFPPRSTVYNIFRKFQRDGDWEAIWAELHMALRSSTKSVGTSPGSHSSGPMAATTPGRLTLRWQRCHGCFWRSSNGATTSGASSSCRAAGWSSAPSPGLGATGSLPRTSRTSR